MWLVVGLGNPGGEYVGTRHNIGFRTTDELLGRMRQPPAARSKLGAEIAEGDIAGQRVLFCKPMEFMNVSGQAVARAAQFWKVEAARTIVVHDELDLPFGQLKLGTGGGHGGHNGVRSLIACLGTPDFARVRMGIDRPPAGQDAAGYVLTAFSRDEQSRLPDVLAEAALAVETVIGSGLPAAMNRFNRRKGP